jgi:DNA-binding MarR family transcriptional regulator
MNVSTDLQQSLAASDQPLGYLLTQVHRGLRSLLDERLGAEGFTMPQVAVLVALLRMPGIPVAELARRAFVTPQAMGEVLAGMEKKCLITRRAHKSDGRMLPARLTPRGRIAMKKCQRHLKAAELKLVSLLPGADVRKLIELLEQCLQGLQAGIPGSHTTT